SQFLLRQKIAEAQTRSPEALGQWEYALGFSELLSGDAAEAHELACDAVEHLEWRDTTGLLPAAQALRAASAHVVGRSAEHGFDVIPASAAHDPKVVMLRGWTAARIAYELGDDAEAARTLVA